MQANRSRDTRPEIAVRHLLHAAGLRYRVAYRPIPGLRRTADVVFTRSRVALFIDGCFWHSCPEHGRDPVTNSGYWTPKLRTNRERDIQTNELLREAGWIVLRFWEHENPAIVVAATIGAVRSRAREA